MKTQILNPLIASFFILVTLIGCQPKTNNNQTSQHSEEGKSSPDAKTEANCILCDEYDTYQITLDIALRLICDFHNKVLNDKSNLSNAGGILSLNAPDKTITNLNQYPTAKFHWALEDTLNKEKRLFITLEGVNKNCDQIKPGIESPALYSTFADNDIAPLAQKGTVLTKNMALRGLLQNFSPKMSYYRSSDIAIAKALLSNFNNESGLKQLYTCDDIVFNYRLTLEAIQSYTGTNQFVYFFGYEEKNTFHKLRLIIAGLDKNNQLVFYNADGISLLRESSRPRP